MNVLQAEDWKYINVNGNIESVSNYLSTTTSQDIVKRMLMLSGMTFKLPIHIEIIYQGMIDKMKEGIKWNKDLYTNSYMEDVASEYDEFTDAYNLYELAENLLYDFLDSLDNTERTDYKWDIFRYEAGLYSPEDADYDAAEKVFLEEFAELFSALCMDYFDPNSGDNDEADSELDLEF